MKCYLDLSRGLRIDPTHKHSPRLYLDVDYLLTADHHNFTNGFLALSGYDFIKTVRTPRHDLGGDNWDFTYKKRIPAIVYYSAAVLSESDGDFLKFERVILGKPDDGVERNHILGNHERAIWPLIGKTAKAGMFKVVREAEYVTSKGQRILALHGDIFDVPVRFHRTREYLGTHAYELLTKACLFGSRLSNNPTVRDVIESWGVKPPKTLSMFLKAKVDAWVFNAAYMQSAFEDVFRRNAKILAEHQKSGKEGPPPYIDILVCGHTHIPMIASAPSPIGPDGKPIGPAQVKIYVVGSWVGPAKAKPGEDDKWWDQATVKPRTAFIVKDGNPDMVIYRPEMGIFSYTPPPLEKGVIVWPDQVKIQPVNG